MPTLQEVFQHDAPVALVTGSGAPRIGRVIARHLASLGCRIALHANNSLKEAEIAATEIRDQLHCEAIVTSGSLRDASVPDRLVNETVDHYGRIDILVNSAAIWHPTRLEEITAEEVRDYFDVNAVSTFLCARAAGLRMAGQSSGGSIVNISDWATVRPYLDHAAYFPSKGAVDAATRSLAVELAQRNANIRVNSILPGPVMLAEDVTDDEAGQIAATTLAGRIGTPEHVAHAVQFLCENDFVNGIALTVDGGRSIYAPDGVQVGLNKG